MSHWSSVAYTSPNWAELVRMVQFVNPKIRVESHLQNIEEIQEYAAELCKPLLQSMDSILITLGENGLMVNFHKVSLYYSLKLLLFSLIC